MKIVLDSIQSQESIDIVYCKNHSTVFLEFFKSNKFRLTSSVHKVSVHGPEILEFFIETTSSGTGCFSEEPVKALIRKIRR